jgi:SEC-C motif-containing protein
MSECPCHSHLSYELCCKKFHEGTLPATALELMRSRYSAYALGLINYIIQTTHKENPSYGSNYTLWKKELKAFCKETLFKNLEILQVAQEGSLAFVTFIATLIQEAREFSFTEKSCFKKEGKTWLYLNGITASGRHSSL